MDAAQPSARAHGAVVTENRFRPIHATCKSEAFAVGRVIGRTNTIPFNRALNQFALGVFTGFISRAELEFAPFHIRVGAIAPGMVKTPMTDGMKDKAREALVDMIPVGRIGAPEDIWLAVRFIIECEYFNGRTIDVDGGLSI